MKIVIDIPESKYLSLMKCFENDVPLGKTDTAIINGTPLPKGHGELVDIRPLMHGLYAEICTGGETYTTSEVYKMLDEECQVIIKADEEGE